MKHVLSRIVCLILIGGLLCGCAAVPAATEPAQPAVDANGQPVPSAAVPTQNTLRFLVNTTIGVLGLIDPATPLGDVRPGVRLLGYARLSPPAPPAEPGGVDVRRMAWVDSLGAVGTARHAHRRAGPRLHAREHRIGRGKALEPVVHAGDGLAQGAHYVVGQA